MVQVPVLSWASGLEERVMVDVPVIDIHELLSYLYNDLGLQTPVEKVQEYWAHCKRHNMPHAVQFPGEDINHIPFSLYGDETNLGQDTSDKCTAIFLQLTLYRPKVVKQGMFLLFSMKDSEMLHDSLETLTPVLRHLTWSANVALRGFFPSCSASGDPLPESKRHLAGRPLAGGRSFACVELKGDWAYHQRVLRLKDIPVAKQICYLCDARADDRSAFKYYDDEEQAPWRRTQVDVQTFINRKVRPGRLSSWSI